MAALRWLMPMLFLTLLLTAVAGRAQGQAPTSTPEQKSYAAAVATKDAGKRAQALEVYIAWYPGSARRIEAHEQAMAAWQAASQPAKADAIAGRLLEIDPDNVRALANRVYYSRTRVAVGDAAVLAPAVAAAERGLAALGKEQKPTAMPEADYVRQKLQLMAIFDGMLGFAALQAKDYARARRYFLESVTIEPDNLQDTYQLSVAQLEGTPLDPLGFWYGARAISVARGAKNLAAAAGIEKYVRARYQRYHGSDDGWEELLAGVANQRVPPDGFANSIPRALTPAEHAVQLMEDNDPKSMSYADWATVLSQRDESPANQAAAERLWKAIADKQKGGASRLKIAVKVIAATPDRIDAAILEASQAANTVDLHVKLARPLAPLPAVGAAISIVGTIVDYRIRPFAFLMTNAELAQESLPVAGGPCAEPRPQMCAKDYRPACGVRRDGRRATYGNACSACADSDVVSQAAGACP